MRFLALDFETNGLPCDKLRPCGAFPTQVSVDAFVPSTGEIVHLYDSFIRGALDVSPWVLQYTPVTLELLDRAPHPDDVATALAQLWQEGDIIVAHNAQFDLDTVLPKIAAPTHPFLTGPSICSKQESWVRRSVGKQPSLADLCGVMKVSFCANSAHDATYDTKVLARCIKAAHDCNRTWSLRVPKTPSQTLHTWVGGTPPVPQTIVDRRVLISREPVEPTAPEDEILRFGRHRGVSFSTALQEHKDFCRYMLGINNPMHNQIPKFITWLRANQCSTCSGLGCAGHAPTPTEALPPPTTTISAQSAASAASEAAQVATAPETQRPVKKRKRKPELPISDSEIVTWGEHEGKTFLEAFNEDRDYCTQYSLYKSNRKVKHRFSDWVTTMICRVTGKPPEECHCKFCERELAVLQGNSEP